MKRAYFYIDDTIWVLRDITRQNPKTLFDNPFMNMLKTAHDKYGLKTQLNLFYRTDYFYGNDEFSLADVTDKYKAEFEENSDWLKMAFHAKQEYPDYPHVNATYNDIKDIFKNIEKEVFRFAGKNSFAYTVCPHWVPMSKDGVRALKDCGVKILDVTYGDTKEFEEAPDSLPYGHNLRLLNNRQPETKLFTRNIKNAAIKNSICGYNHLSFEEGEKIKRTNEILWNDEIGLYFKKFCSAGLNLTPYDGIEEEYTELSENNYIGICDHEQYFYSDYFAYQPDYADKIYKMCEILTSKGFTFICGEDLLKK
ncbi:MAG: hypothetical protein IKA17_09585 [Clostridia bacterium]|nr:hypothetical protein [Clostridia bacterium]